MIWCIDWVNFQFNLLFVDWFDWFIWFEARQITSEHLTMKTTLDFILQKKSYTDQLIRCIDWVNFQFNLLFVDWFDWFIWFDDHLIWCIDWVLFRFWLDFHVCFGYCLVEFSSSWFKWLIDSIDNFRTFDDENNTL